MINLLTKASSCDFFSVDKEYMLDIKTGTKPISFGDFSYYWIVGIKSVSVMPEEAKMLAKKASGRYFDCLWY